LGKLNIDKNPELVESLQVSQIPTVFALYNMKPIGNFVGVPTDSSFQEFIDMLLKKGGENNVHKYLVEAEQFLKEEKIAEATKIYKELLEQKNLKAESFGLAGLARCALAEKQLDLAQQLIQTIKDKFHPDIDHPEIKKAIAAVDLAIQSAPLAKEQQDLIDKIKQNPNDLQIRYDLALSYFQNGRYSQALEECFEIIKRDKYWNSEAARKLCLKIFDALGPKNELVKSARKKLSSLLF
jgi:putative thioredoxin